MPALYIHKHNKKYASVLVLLTAVTSGNQKYITFD